MPPTLSELLHFAESRALRLRQDLVPASAMDIKHFAAVAETDLPGRFLEFLTIAGINAKALALAHANFDIQSLSARYEVNAPGHDRRYLLIAIDQEETYEDYYLDCVRGDERDAPIVRFDYESPDSLPRQVFHSFAELTCHAVLRVALIRPSVHRLERQVSVSMPTAALSELRTRLTVAGFRSALVGLPASMLAMEHASAVVVARVCTEGSSIALMLGAPSKRALLTLQETLLLAPT